MVRWRFLKRRQGGRTRRDRGRNEGVRPRTAAGSSGLGRRLACSGIILLVGLVAAVGAILWDMRETALRDGYRVIALKGVAVAEQTARAVQAVDLVLQDLQADIMAHPAAAPLGSDARLKSLPFQLYLRDSLRNLPQLEGLSVADGEGRLVAWSRGWPVADIDISDREYVPFFRTHRDAGTFLSAPVRSRGDGSWTFFLARRIEDRDHRMLGVVAAALSIRYFNDFYRAVTDHGTESVTLLRRDGILFARFPATADQVGEPFMRSPLWSGMVAVGGGEYVTPGYRGERARLISVHPLSAYPLVVDVGLTRGSALGTWRHTAGVILAGALLAAAVLGVLLRLLCLQLRKLEAQRLALAATARELRDSELHLHENARQLATTLTHMDQGLIMVDAALHVVVCNARAIELLGLPPDLMAQRPHFSVLLQHQFATGEFQHTEPGLVERFDERNVRAAPAIYERMRPNGCILEIRSTWLEGGGMVRTYTDVTARRAAEEQLRYHARHDDLTGLANRQVFRRSLEMAVDSAAARGGAVALLYVDLDRFKQVNDTCGHAVGDALLQIVAARLIGHARGVDAVARIGGDEFTILMRLAEDGPAPAALAERLVAELSRPYEIDGMRLEIGASIGIACGPRDAATAEGLIRCADAALYAAKHGGRSTVRHYTASRNAA